MPNHIPFPSGGVSDADATATFERNSFDGKLHSAEEIHHQALVSLHDEFATVIDTKGILDSLEC
ncbi:hypothetical protein ACQCN2_15975 [Brevibacillus ginsengisoli]|uniref:hypothetical protein n=1 Tax=Brevibacillus ginsengisoli TaxID=363854 RepID=UPI003CECDE1F